jgi:tRNA splicing endonuclease
VCLCLCVGIDDPLIHHAALVVVVKRSEQLVGSQQLTGLCRLAVGVKKTAVLAVVDTTVESPCERVRFLSLTWKGVT